MQTLLLALPRFAQFLARITDKWLDDGTEFVHTALPKLVIIGVGAWIMIRLLAAGTRRLTALAESRAAGNARAAQVRTLAPSSVPPGFSSSPSWRRLRYCPCSGLI